MNAHTHSRNVDDSVESFGGTLRGGILRIPSEDCSQLVEWQAAEGVFDGYTVSIMRRVVGSYWEYVTVGIILEELRKGGAVATWLRRCTRANATYESLSLREPSEDAHLKMLDYDSEGSQFGRIMDRAEEILEAKYELVWSVDYAHGSLVDAVMALSSEQLSDDKEVESGAQQVAAIVQGRKPGPETIPK